MQMLVNPVFYNTCMYMYLRISESKRKKRALSQCITNNRLPSGGTKLAAIILSILKNVDWTLQEYFPSSDASTLFIVNICPLCVTLTPSGTLVLVDPVTFFSCIRCTSTDGSFNWQSRSIEYPSAANIFFFSWSIQETVLCITCEH